MRAPLTRTCSIIATLALFIATLARTGAASVSTSPSPEDKWLYPDVNTSPTYNYLDIVNASWTSNFGTPYLLLRCQPPNDTVHYAYPYNQSVPATGSALVPLDDGNAWVCHFEISDLGTLSTTPPTFTSNDFNIVIHNGQKPVLWTDSHDGGENAASSVASNSTMNSTTSASSASSPTTSSPLNTTHPPLSSATSTPTTSPTTLTSSTPLPQTPASPPTTPPSPHPNGLSKSTKVAIIVGSTMGALLLLIIGSAAYFILGTRRSEHSAVMYRSAPGEDGDGDEGKEVPGSEAPRERWKWS